MDSLRIKKLDLLDVGPFKSLEIELPNEAGLNIICGSNGIGKSTILEAILSIFASGSSHRLKKRATSEYGNVSATLSINGSESVREIKVKSFNPAEGDYYHHYDSISSSLINIRASRDFGYRAQTSIERDPNFDINSFTQSIADGIRPEHIKTWFTNRYLLEPHSENSSWTAEMKENLALAKECFSTLDKSVKLAEVNIRTYDIIASTPSGNVPFELLSSGFRSAYTLLLGIIREIETRDLQVSARKFSGVILIDEIDLHLHPAWQKEIGLALKSSFPLAQIIATTHSPHVIQAAEADEVVALARDDAGKVFVRPLPTTTYGYAGWTIEEILEDIMGLEDSKTGIFRQAVKGFDNALDSSDVQSIERAIHKLNEMLHPTNPLRKLIKLQAAPFLERNEDEELE